MSAFPLIAPSDMSLEQGNMVTKALVFEVKVKNMASMESNVLLNSESRASIMRQLANRDVDLVANRKEYFLNRCNSQVEERRNVLANGYY